MKKNPAALLIFIVMLPAVITSITKIKSWDTTINADGYGYYAYLPCTFIYHHLDYSRVMAEEHKLRPNIDSAEIMYPFVRYGDNKRTDKYFIGVSILLVPFFLLAYFLSYLFGYDLSGYSILFQESVALGALFYLFLGLFFIRKIMCEYYINGKIIFFCLILILYGTNLFYYASISPSMSHVYSFGLQAMFFYSIKRAFQVPRIRNLLIATILFSLLFLIRPTNILSLAAILFLAGDLKNLRRFLSDIFHFKKIAIILISVFLILSIQFVKWYIETGKWYIWGYSGEGFVFSTPHFFDILFSYRKGWFIYTPVMFIILSGIILLFIRLKRFFQLGTILIFFLLTTYVCSCWWEWWYGGSFGMRAFVDYYPFYALLLGILLMEVKNSIVKTLVFALPVLCLVICIIQTIQYDKFIFSYGNMTKQRYWNVFLKTDSKYGWIYEDPSSKLSLFDHPNFYNDFEKNSIIPNISNRIAHSGHFSLFLNPHTGNIPIYSLNVSDLPNNSCVWMYTSLWAYTNQLDNDVYLITKIKSAQGNVYFTNTRNLMDDLPGSYEWDRIQHIDMLPSNIPPNDSIIISEACTKDSAYIDDIGIRFGTKR